MKDNDLVKKMKDYTITNNLKKYELARVLNTTEANISHWLSGKHKISKAWRELIKQKLK